MRIDELMRYPHPVVVEDGSDYRDATFEAEFERSDTPDRQLRIAAKLAIRQPALESLISRGNASAGFFAVCRRTYYNRLFPTGLGQSETFIPLASLFGTVQLRPVAWTTESVEGFASAQMHPEFGERLTIAKGALLALGPEFRLSVDPQRFKPFESIFELSAHEGIEPGMLRVDSGGDRIAVLASPETHSKLALMRNVPSGKSMMLSAVFVPAVMEIVALLQSGDTSLQATKWYRIFSAKCDEMGIDPTQRAESPLVIAQRLLKAPLGRLIPVIERLT